MLLGCWDARRIWFVLQPMLQLLNAAGVANARVRALKHARDLGEHLERKFAQSNQSVWVAVQNRGEDDPDQYWIGKAL